MRPFRGRAASFRPWVRLSAALLAVVLTATGCVGRDAVSSADSGGGYIAGSGALKRYPVGDRKAAPDVSGRTLDGTMLRLADYRGRTLVVNFWASWCPPCRAENAALAQASRDTKASGVAFLGVNFKEEASQARIYSERQRTPYPSLLDRYGEVTVRFSPSVPPQSIPTTLVIDRQGRIAASIFGEITYTRLMSLLRSVAAERAT
ncbi:MAG: TlpA disulfide reductase family protein [Frankiaceae bacterium]